MKGGTKARIGGLAVACLLASCDSAVQDAGGLGATPVSGVVVDGHIARALVYADGNGNYRLEAWEPFAFADIDGYFSTSKDGVNYCESAAMQDLCLRVNVTQGTVLRMMSGYDAVTGEPFVGTLSRQVVAGETAVGTPLTSLLSDMQGSQVSDFLGAVTDEAGVPVTRADLESNVLDFSTDLDSGLRAYLVGLGLRAHKMADVIAAHFAPLYPGFGTDDAYPPDATGYIYSAIRSEWLKPCIAGCADAETIIGNVISQSDENIAMALGVAPSGTLPALAPSLTKFLEFIKSAFSTSLTQTEIEARLRASEILTGVMRDNKGLDAVFVQAVIAMLNTNLGATPERFGVALDVNDVVREVLAMADPSGYVIRDYAAERTTLDLADLDGLALSNGTDNATFSVESDGSLTLALDYSSGSGGLNSDGGAISGSVEALNGYSLLLTLSVAGVTKPVVLTKGADGSYRFDYDQSTDRWSE